MTADASIRWGRFIWNAEKERHNLLRHGISFRMAARAFMDADRMISSDENHSYQEPRWFCIGKVGSEVVTVRFTYRGKQIRMIGAGIWRKGRKLYEAKISARS